MLFFRKGTYLGSVSQIYDIEGAVTSITTYPEKYRNDHRHYHENAHLSFVLQGGSLEKRKCRDIERVPGKVTIYEPGEPHQITRIEDSSKHLNIEIDHRFLHKYDIHIDVFRNHNTAEDSRARCTLLKVFNEIKYCDVHSGTSIHSLLLALLHSPKSNYNVTSAPPWIRKVKEMLHDRWNESVTLDDLSHIAGVHPVTISKHFPKHYGVSIGAFIRRIKVEKAAVLIKNTDLSLTEIAFECGFSDQSHFIRLFKKHTGFLPKRYQQL